MKSKPMDGDQLEGLETARYHVPNLQRALLIMEFLATQPHGCGLSEIARELTLPKNSVFRIAATLRAHGYLVRAEDDKTYRLSRKLLSLGYAAIDEHNLVEKSIDVMRQVRDLTDETALIGVLVGNQGVVIEQVPSNQPVKFVIRIGHHFPLHTGAPGKAMLAFMPPAECEAMIGRMQFTRFNDQTITDPSAFRRELEEVRDLGYALDRGEEMEDLHCAAAPILNHRGYPLASIWITGPASRMPLKHLPRLGAIVAGQTALVSARFGYGMLRGMNAEQLDELNGGAI